MLRAYDLNFIAQLEALNLPCRRFRQVGDEFDPARIFIRGEPAFDMLLQCCRQLRGVFYVRAKNDIRLGFNQAIFIGLRNDCGFEHGGVRSQCGFDFKG